MFVDHLENQLNKVTITQNACLDLFGKIGACREDLNQAKQLFAKAYEENAQLATQILFWVRDIRGGQGERKVFKELLKDLASIDPQVVQKLIPLVPEFGRWDDLLILEDTSVWDNVLDSFRQQLDKDLKAKEGQISLLAKWLPSINASSKDSKRQGRKIANFLGYSEKQYRKTLSALRSKIKIVEQKMCANEWENIEYSKVPSRASFMYRNAFKSHDSQRYTEFLADVASGKVKINTSTLYPYEIVYQFLFGEGEVGDQTLELLWNNLPNYLEDQQEGFNGLVVADVSGSMVTNSKGKPMAVSISLAMYIAERNQSEVWKNKFLTFTDKPSLETIKGSTLQEKISNLGNSDWGYNTNLVKVFEAILQAAKVGKVPQDQMPQKLILVSDMEFDEACQDNDLTNFEHISHMFEKAGYKLPDLIFWNVNSGSSVPVTVHDSGTALLSGYSPSALKAIFSEDITPLSVMLESVDSERYLPVKLVF
jgi:hypothetical protein